MLDDELTAKLVGKHWYRVSVMGQAGGWALYDTWADNAADGSKRLMSRQRLHFSIVLNGQRLSASSETTVETDENLRPVRISLAANELGREKTVLAVARGRQLEVKVEGGGKSSAKLLPLPEDWGSDLQFSARAAEGKLKTGESFTVSIFDPEVVDFDRHKVTVGEWTEMEAGGQRRRLLLLDDATERLNLKIRTYVDASGVMWRQEVPGIMNLVLDKVNEQEARAEGQPLSLSNRVAVDQPVGDARAVSRLKVRAAMNRAPDAAPFPETSRQKAVKTGEATYDVAVVHAQEPGESAGWPLTVPEDLKSLTIATGIAQAGDEDMKRQAAEIVAGKTSAWEAARAIVQWVYAHMRKVASEPRPVTASEVLRDMVGDCTEHALLVGTLARSVGMPSKMCVGLGYVGDAFYYHAWAKLWVGEWVEMDPTWGENTVDATHVEVAEGGLDELSMARMSLATARVLGQLEFKVLDIQRGK
jgi:hypothetical protein